MWPQVAGSGASQQDMASFFSRAGTIRLTDKINGPEVLPAINDNSDAVSIPEFADRTAGQGLWSHVANAGAGGHT